MFLNVFSQLMVATRSGIIGLSAAGHVMEEGKTVIVHAPDLCQETVEETAENWDTLKSQGRAKHISAQVNDFNYLERYCRY